MRIKPRRQVEETSMDMTPMIDMTFQLIAFFMMLINFSQDLQDTRVEVPVSALAKPSEDKAEDPLVLQFTKSGTVLVSGDEVEVGPALEGLLGRERRAYGAQKNRKVSEVVVIIRGDRRVGFGKIQEAVELCQKAQFERFRFRAKEGP